MISPEILRRYPFFNKLDEQQLRSLAMLADEVVLKKGDVLMEEGQPARKLCFLMKGCVDLYYVIEESYQPEQRKEVLVSEINPGEPFGISALIEPHVLTGSVRSCRDSHIITFNADALRELFRADPALENLMLHKVAQAALGRLNATRIQLAAANYG